MPLCLWHDCCFSPEIFETKSQCFPVLLWAKVLQQKTWNASAEICSVNQRAAFRSGGTTWLWPRSAGNVLSEREFRPNFGSKSSLKMDNFDDAEESLMLSPSGHEKRGKMKLVYRGLNQDKPRASFHSGLRKNSIFVAIFSALPSYYMLKNLSMKSNFVSYLYIVELFLLNRNNPTAVWLVLPGMHDKKNMIYAN